MCIALSASIFDTVYKISILHKSALDTLDLLAKFFRTCALASLAPPDVFSPSPTELRGFILKRHGRDVTDGTEIEYWVANDEGAKKVLLTGQTSVAFLPA